MFSTGTPIHVRKLSASGALAYAWDGAVLASDTEELIIQANFNVPFVDLGPTTLRAGDIFIEFYYWQRWYNVFQVFTPGGALKGWYGNVGRPIVASGRTEIEYLDLELDLWVDPDGAFMLLDQPEFAALLAGDLPAETRQGALDGRDALVSLAAQRRLPDWQPFLTEGRH